MKLSQLEALIHAVRARSHEYPSNPDPDIRFWITRTPRLLAAGSHESEQFVEFDIDWSEEVINHRICAAAPNVKQGKGDYTIPLLVVPFYK